MRTTIVLLIIAISGYFLIGPEKVGQYVAPIENFAKTQVAPFLKKSGEQLIKAFPSVAKSVSNVVAAIAEKTKSIFNNIIGDAKKQALESIKKQVNDQIDTQINNIGNK